jgi:hypothetical protein
MCDRGARSTRCACTVASELIWDGATAATAIGRQGQSLRLGDEWTPEILFSLGVESDLMRTFLRLADEASLVVRAYLSAGHLIALQSEERRLVISVCIVVDSAAAEGIAEDLWRDARQTAGTAAMLGRGLTVEASITVVGADAASAAGTA